MSARSVTSAICTRVHVVQRPPSDGQSRRISHGEGWRSKLLLCGDTGGPGAAVQANLANAITFLENAPELAGLVSFDEFTQRVKAFWGTSWAPQEHEWGEIDDIRLVEWLQRHGCRVKKTIARQAVAAVARERPYRLEVGCTL